MKKRWFALVCTAFLVVIGFSGQPRKAGGQVREAGGQMPGAPQAEDAKPLPPKLRLGGSARPVRYAADLTIVPAEDSFQGAIDIDVRLRGKTGLFWLNATDISIGEATASIGGKTIAVRTVPGERNFVGLAFDPAVGPGSVQLHISYKGVLNKTDTAGLFKQKEGEDWYVFTQFEATDARRAFPCFDEPSFKVPWQLTLHIPKGDKAVSNTPQVSETAGSNGMKTVKFAQTKPLPSYLVALGVGPFDIVDAGKAGKKKTPIRIITPRGKASRARYAAEATPQLFEILERYFGVSYPYEKLDSLAIPQTVGFGAMENAGLITYNERILLAAPEEETLRFKRGFAGTGSHEIAHQWFGDLVTMAWWNDIWLNEAFATWLARKNVIQWKPEWEEDVSRVSARSGSMRSDTLVTARKIRQPVESEHDIRNAFDGITYGKGAAVLSMFEAWMGEKKFAGGVRRYLTAHSYGNATAEDFLKALEGGTSSGIAAAFSTFLDQPGVPLVSAELSCGSGGPPRLLLSQGRFLPIGSKGSTAQLWQIPICVRYRAGNSEERSCKLMTKETEEMPLSSHASCPDGVLANDAEAGYYHVLYRGDLLARLLVDGGRALTIPERVGVLGDVAALAEGGAMPVGEALAFVPQFAKDPSRHIVSATVRIAAVREDFVPEELRANYARLLQAMYGERARSLGFLDRPGEDDDTRLLRQSLVGLAANRGEDEKLREEARALALKWLEDRKAVGADLAGTVLTVAARSGDRALFERFHAEAKKATERRDRQRLLSALGSLRNPEILKDALKIFLTDEFDSREAASVLFMGAGDESSRQIRYDFVKQNFDAIVAKLPRDSGASLVFAGAGFCDQAHGADVEAFFKDRAGKFMGGPRNLAQVLERISLCAASKEAQLPAIRAFLEKY